MVPPVKLTALREAAIQACDAFIGTIRDAHDKFSPLIAAIVSTGSAVESLP